MEAFIYLMRQQGEPVANERVIEGRLVFRDDHKYQNDVDYASVLSVCFSKVPWYAKWW